MNYVPPPNAPPLNDLLFKALTPDVVKEKMAVKKVLNKYGVDRNQMLRGIPQGQTRSPQEIYE